MPVNMRGDYYVVPPNGARIRMGAQDYLASRVTRVPDLIGGPWPKVFHDVLFSTQIFGFE